MSLTSPAVFLFAVDHKTLDRLIAPWFRDLSAREGKFAKEWRYE